jgi:hypothetical protein
MTDYIVLQQCQYEGGSLGHFCLEQCVANLAYVSARGLDHNRRRGAHHLNSTKVIPRSNGAEGDATIASGQFKCPDSQLTPKNSCGLPLLEAARARLPLFFHALPPDFQKPVIRGQNGLASITEEKGGYEKLESMA